MRYLQTNSKTVKAKLDAKDKKILSFLSANARIPLTQLCKKVGLSRDGVNYRIKKYEKDGVVQGYRTMVDMTKFGYHAYHLFIKLNNPTKEVESVLLKKLASLPFIRAILKFSGNYDFEIAFIAKDIEDLDNAITTMVKECSNYLQDYEVLTVSKTFVAETFPPNFSSNGVERKTKKNEEFSADAKDISILKMISEDPLRPVYEISNKVGLSGDAVAYRIRKMVDSGLIIKFIPVINYTSLDYNLHTVLMNIKGFDEEKEKKLKRFLSTDKNTLWAVKTIGRFNVLIYLLVKNIDDLQETLLELRSLFPGEIANYETLIAYEEYKYVYFPKEMF